MPATKKSIFYYDYTSIDGILSAIIQTKLITPLEDKVIYPFNGENQEFVTPIHNDGNIYYFIESKPDINWVSQQNINVEIHIFLNKFDSNYTVYPNVLQHIVNGQISTVAMKFASFKFNDNPTQSYELLNLISWWDTYINTYEDLSELHKNRLYAYFYCMSLLTQQETVEIDLFHSILLGKFMYLTCLSQAVPIALSVISKSIIFEVDNELINATIYRYGLSKSNINKFDKILKNSLALSILDTNLTTKFVEYFEILNATTVKVVLKPYPMLLSLIKLKNADDILSYIGAESYYNLVLLLQTHYNLLPSDYTINDNGSISFNKLIAEYF